VEPGVRLVDIRESPLNVEEVLDSVDSDQAGGVVIFVGRVRDHDASQQVESLGYAAHPTAIARLREVCDGVALRHDLHAIAAVHRVGDLAIGDIAVIVATSSSHREESFAATRDLIDTLKREVPIWKHQRFRDAAAEWVGSP
jgi:molybdopterin synthase catalytic subunit